MKLDYDNTRTQSNAEIDAVVDLEKKSPLEIFSEFFELQNNKEMTSEQTEFMRKLISEVWEAK